MFLSTFPHGERPQLTGHISDFNSEFQSTFPHGERHRPDPISRIVHRFNPRSHTGNDKQCKCDILHYGCFNPRSHTGNDNPVLSVFVRLKTVSIHVPTRGTTALVVIGYSSESMFQSTLPHGERRAQRYPAQIRQMFQSTFPHGERPGRIIPQKGEWMFQSTFPHGERRLLFGKDSLGNAFQSTFPHGERPS